MSARPKWKDRDSTNIGLYPVSKGFVSENRLGWNPVKMVLIVGCSMIGWGCSTQSHLTQISDQPSQLTDHQKIALKTADGYYIRAVKGGGDDVVADVTILQTSGIFTFEWFDKENSKIRLKTRGGYYIHAPGDGRVDAKVEVPLTSEVFTLEWVSKEKMTLRLRTRDGFYLHVRPGEEHTIEAKVEKPKAADIFELVIQES